MSKYTDLYVPAADYYDPDSWVEISSQPSSSSLSSIGEEVITTGLRVQHDPRARRRRSVRQNAPTNLDMSPAPTSTGASSQEEYEESESESDKVMSSSNEGPLLPSIAGRPIPELNWQRPISDDDDENKTAINHPIRNEECFTPQPNAFTYPPSGQLRTPNQQASGSYFPSQRREPRSSSRTSLPTESRRSHMPPHSLSPSYDPTIHDEALRTSLSTLLSCAAAARSLGKPDTKRPTAPTITQPQPRSTRIDPMSFRLVPESALQPRAPQHLQEPTFHPTIRRQSTSPSTSTSTSSDRQKDSKRKAPNPRSSSRERRAMKKARRTSSSAEELYITPTLLTWVVSAGVVVVLSALSFSAGYSIGKEAGRIEGGAFAADEQIRSCAREAGRAGVGLKRSLVGRAVQV